MSSTEHFDELERRLSELVKDAVQQVKDEFKEKLRSTREQVEEIVGNELNSAREAASSAEADATQAGEALAAAEHRAYEAAEALAAAESRMAEMAEALEAAEGRAAESGGSLEAIEARASEVSAALEVAEARAAEAAEAQGSAEARAHEILEAFEAAEGRIAELSEALGSAEAAAAEAAGAISTEDPLSRVMEALSEVDQGRTQAQVLQGLLSGAGDFSARTALFLTDPAGLRGWGHRGFGAGTVEFDEILIDYSEGAAQSRLAAGRGVVELSDEDCVAICSQIDGSRPRSGVLIPLVLANRLAAALYADQFDENPIDVSALQLLAYLAGLALETLPLREGGSAVTLQFESEASTDAGLELWDFAPSAPVLEPEVPDAIEDVADLEATQDAEAVEEADEAPEPVDYQPAEDSGFAVEMADDSAMDTTTALLDEEPAAELEPVEEMVEAAEDSDVALEEAYVEEVEEAVEVEELAADVVEEAVEQIVEEEEEVEAAPVDEVAVKDEEIEETAPETTTEVAPPPPAASAGPQVAPPDDLEGPGWAFQTRTLGGEGDEDSTHEEARRLARLLVTEIKLYNEEQVEEGRRNRNIYQTLREDIDRSRQIYEERVDEGVRTNTNYFHDELVRILAAGEFEVLGI
jgi:hypothetical protein